MKASVEEAVRAKQSAVVTENRAILDIGYIGYFVVRLEFVLCVGLDVECCNRLGLTSTLRCREKEQSLSSKTQVTQTLFELLRGLGTNTVLQLAEVAALPRGAIRSESRKIHDTKQLVERVEGLHKFY